MFLLLFLVGFVFGVERKYTIVLSDSHVGGDWFNGDIVKYLPQYLRKFTEKETDVHTVVLAGDFFDFWLRSFDEYCPTPVEFFQHQFFKKVNISEYIEIFKLIIKNDVELVYVVGNHDDALRYEDFVSVGLKDINFNELIYDQENFQIEHGHIYDLYNSPDPAGTIKSFGYYITRASVEGGGHKEGTTPIFYWICDHILSLFPKALRNATWLSERLIGGALGEEIWEEIINKKYQENRNKNIINGCFYKHSKENCILHEAVHKYRTVVGRLLMKYDNTIVSNLIKGMCMNIEFFLKQKNVDLSVMGHQHKPELTYINRETIKGGKLIYANTGAWIASSDYLPIVRITQPNKKNATYVELLEWNAIDNIYIIKGESNIPFRGIHIDKISKYNSQFNYKEKLHIPTIKIINYTRKGVPKQWRCDPDFYASGDGCDCNCGIWDPDCGPIVPKCEPTCKKKKKKFFFTYTES